MKGVAYCADLEIMAQARLWEILGDLSDDKAIELYMAAIVFLGYLPLSTQQQHAFCKTGHCHKTTAKKTPCPFLQ